MEPGTRIGEVAKRTGVSVRTLHHYDRIGLVTPTGRTSAGYRLYGPNDVLRLQQVLTLRFLGFSLAKIKGLLTTTEAEAARAIRAQRATVRGRIAELRKVDRALADLLSNWQRTGHWSTEMLARSTATINQGIRNQGGKTMRDLYTEEHMRAFEELGATVTREEVVAVETAWINLVPRIKTQVGTDPASATAQALLQEWEALLERTLAPFHGRHELTGAIGDNFHHNRFPSEQEGLPDKEIFTFIQRATEARDQP